MGAILLKQPFDPDKRLSDVCQLDGGEDHGQQQKPLYYVMPHFDLPCRSSRIAFL
jgi:hypothetical protein